MKAVIAYQKKKANNTSMNHPRSAVPKLDQEMENRRKIIIRSFCIAKDIYVAKFNMPPSLEESDLEAGAEFLEVFFFFQVLRTNADRRVLLGTEADIAFGFCDGYRQARR